MSYIIDIFKFIKEAVKLIIVLASYNPWTIAGYFRKQGAHIGEDCFILTRTLGPEPYLVSLGNHVFIAEGVRFNTHDGGEWILKDEIPNIEIYGPIVIEDNCIIGNNTVLLPNTRIGKNSIIGAGSVVVSDIPPDSVAMGVPARAFGSSVKYREKCIAKWNEQGIPTDHTYEEDKRGRYFKISSREKERREAVKNYITKIWDDYFSY